MKRKYLGIDSTPNGDFKVYELEDGTIEKEETEESPEWAKLLEESIKKDQDLHLLNKTNFFYKGKQLTELEKNLHDYDPVTVDWIFLPMKYLDDKNKLFYLREAVERMEHWKQEHGPLHIETAKTLEILKNELVQIEGEKNIEVKDKDALIKLQAPSGPDKLKALFADLEQQRMVAPGTTGMLEDHFTESALAEAVPEDSSPIEWKERKYKAVNLLRRLRGRNPPWLKASDEEISKHFILSDKKPINPAGFSIKVTDDLSRIDKILDDHLKCTD